MTEFEKLDEQLREHGCTVERDNQRALVTLEESGSTWVLLSAGDWIQVAASVLDCDELGEEGGRAALNEFIMRVHARYLGCRFGFDEDGALVVMSDVYPENIRAAHLLDVMNQMDSVAGALLPLLHAAILSGQVPAESEIDRAFSMV